MFFARSDQHSAFSNQRSLNDFQAHAPAPRGFSSPPVPLLPYPGFPSLEACRRRLQSPICRFAGPLLASSVDSLVQWIEEAVADVERVVLVAEQAGSVIGFGHGLLKKSPPVVEPRLNGFVTDLVVTEAFRRQGVGSRLLDALASWFADHGADSVTLVAAAKSDAALAFYYAQGFEHWTSTLRKPLKTETPPGAQ